MSTRPKLRHSPKNSSDKSDNYAAKKSKLMSRIFQRCQDVIRISVQLIVIYLLLDPSSNHKLLCCVKCTSDFCGSVGEEPESVIRLASYNDLESSATSQGLLLRSQRIKRSPPRLELNIWDELELLFRAYQEQRLQQEQQNEQQHKSHSDNQNHQDNINNQESRQATTTLSDHDVDSRVNTRRLQVGQTRGQQRGREGRGSQLSAANVRGADSAGGVGGGGTGDQSAPPPAAVKVIETAVFIDQALDNKFAGLSNGLVELNKLVLTIMNQVQYLFEYSSLQVAIRLKLVLIEHLRESERLIGLAAPNSERGDIDAYLSNFCNWQQNRLNREKRLWWDHAILLSGLDLYKATPGKNHSGVLGLAWVGGMCKGNYSCTINEASNFESAFVISHEIGHSLGIMHDGQKNKCDPNSFIMSERTGAGKVHWSRCSNGYLNDSLARGQLKCLESEQNNQIDSLYDLAKLRAPGQVYTINEQCKLAFGTNYSSFVTQQAPFNAICRELWCVSGTWAKAAHPALEGSPCAGQQELVCREGKCARVQTN